MTPKQKRFVEEYIAHGNAAAAARRAGYAPSGAGSNGWRLLHRPDIAAALKEAGIEIAHPPRKPGERRGAPRGRRRGLTVLEQRFVAEYLKDGNATGAAIRAGLKTSTPTQGGGQMLKRPRVATAIQRERALAAERTRIDQERILREYARIALAEIGSVADWDEAGLQLLPKAAIGEDDRAAIQEIAAEPGENGPRLRVKMHAKLPALDALAKYLGMWGRGAKVIAAAAEDPLSRDAVAELRERLLRIARQGSAGFPAPAEEEKEETDS